jgi:hypothetical protein
MKQNKLLILSLLASFVLLTLASYANAQNSVTFGTIDVCPQPAGATVLVPVTADNDFNLFGFDIIGQIVSDGNVDLVVSGVTFDNRMELTDVLDQRYDIGDLGGGIFRLGAVKVSGTDLTAGSGQIATLELTFLSDCVLGTAVIDPASYECNGSDNSTMFVAGDGSFTTPDITSGAVNVVNVGPTFTNCPEEDFTIFWKSGTWGTNQVNIAFTADDPDLACGCDVLTYTPLMGPGSVNSSEGTYSFTAGYGDIGCHQVMIEVSDRYGAADTCTFNITVTNNAPEFVDCPPSDVIYVYTWGQLVSEQLTATDLDMGPMALQYSIESTDMPGTGPNAPHVDAATGEFTWLTEEDPMYVGVFYVTIRVTDGAPSSTECPIPNDDYCTLTFKLDPKFRVYIEKDEGEDGQGALLGHYTDVEINMDDSYESVEMGGFDFLIGYDQSVLTLVEAEMGEMLTGCNWEYFTYRHGYDGNCGTGCPSGMVRLVAMAETNNGPYHPTCWTNVSSSNLANLTFFVINDHLYDCQYARVFWYWMDCGDNAISSKYGDTLFLEDRVFDFEDFEDTLLYDPSIWEITDHPELIDSFPSYTGTADECLWQHEYTKGVPVRFIDFRNGGVDIICDSLIDDRGDINMNGIGYEIADAVMLTNYFISGLGAFGSHIDGSIAASDVNDDGATLTVADMVYLIRVIQGDAVPYAKPNPDAVFNVATQKVGNSMTVDVETTHDAGAALFVFDVSGEVGNPTLADGVNMEIAYGVENAELRVLVYNIGPASITTGDLMTIPVEGDIELKEVEAADFNGSTMTSTFLELPSTFALAQNYPNPFNPTTMLSLDLPVASNYTLEIYNIAGQKVRAYNGFSEAGVVEIMWDGKDASGSVVASGVYFYKMVAGDFSATKRMIMLK